MKKLKLQGLARRVSRLSVLATVAAATIIATHASAQIVNNGNFQTDDSSSSGYAGYGAIPGFTSTTASNVGRNGYDIRFDRNPSDTNEIETQFAPPGYTPSMTGDPRDLAFLQSTGAAISQTVSLTANTEYTLSFLSGTRNGDPDATGTASIKIGTSVFSLSTTDPSVTPTNPPVNGFTSYSLHFFTALGQTSALLSLANTTTAAVNAVNPDQTVDFADVAITATGTNAYAPEPSTYALLGLGALGLLLAARRKVSGS